MPEIIRYSGENHLHRKDSVSVLRGRLYHSQDQGQNFSLRTHFDSEIQAVGGDETGVQSYERLPVQGALRIDADHDGVRPGNGQLPVETEGEAV